MNMDPGPLAPAFANALGGPQSTTRSRRCPNGNISITAISSRNKVARFELAEGQGIYNQWLKRWCRATAVGATLA